jgi:hypothetical protein
MGQHSDLMWQMFADVADGERWGTAEELEENCGELERNSWERTNSLMELERSWKER